MFDKFSKIFRIMIVQYYLLYFIILWIFLYVIAYFLNLKKNNIKSNKNLIVSKPTQSFMLREIDKYYINNKNFSTILVIFYLFSLCLPVIILRIFSLGHHTYISKQINLYESLLSYIFVIIIFMITWVLYNNLLDKMIGTELNKIHLLLYSNKWYGFFCDLIIKNHTKYFFSFIRCYFYTIAELSYDEEPFLPSSRNVQQLEALDFKYRVIENKILRKYLTKLAVFLMFYVEKYTFFQNIIFKISYIFRFLRQHIEGFFYTCPYFILIMIFVFELINKELFYIYYFLLFFYIIKLKNQYKKFLQEKNPWYDWKLAEYFYFNKNSYEQKRKNFLVEDQPINWKTFSPDDTQGFLNSLENIYIYIQNNFKEEDFSTPESLFKEKLWGGIYKRFFVILIFILLFFFSLTKVIYSLPSFLFLLFSLVIIVFLHVNAYVVKEYNEYIHDEERVYKKNYNYLFWILSSIIAYIFWIILLRPELLLLSSEILINYPPFIITKIYTSQEKMLYLFQYFEFLLSQPPLEDVPVEKENMRYLLRCGMEKFILDGNCSLNHIQIFIHSYINNYLQYSYFQNLLYSFPENLQENFPYMNIILTLFFLGSLTYIYYPFIFTFFKLQSFKGTHEVIESLLHSTNKAQNFKFPNSYPKIYHINMIKKFSGFFKKIFEYFFES